ncbi:hypothetical protein HN371_21505 [Candidatus Poribacteria bacterium]|jgi:hypothetical protein|nr:hypothetical protein [Candidatus Poribacteria bacterium]MBT5535498.1 hypothetical protein [Candidatus Poribacteria bacterium]MBT7096977.1 hypothetical protein [Candidatus Poribacteria bacterium]MBT7806066.1 hypothetical protein [Candidatus Poribacteria bacterium]
MDTVGMVFGIIGFTFALAALANANSALAKVRELRQELADHVPELSQSE